MKYLLFMAVVIPWLGVACALIAWYLQWSFKRKYGHDLWDDEEDTGEL